LLHTTELNHWNNASHFFAEFIWTYIVQSKAGTATPRPAQAVYPFFQRMLKTEQLAPTFEALKNVNFYQVVDTNGKELHKTAEYQESFSVAINTSWAAWTEVEKMLTAHYPAFWQSGGATYASEVWEHFKRDKRSVLLLARSVQVNEDRPDDPPMILGFLAGGIHPTSENPHIMAVCVLPDERRRGIGRALVRRFFAHTAYNEVWCQLHIKPGSEPYEQAAFLTSLNGILKRMHISFWAFEMVNPFLK
jgi:GNAT superfamily N-acetyltransferase